jgi:hypothetical protein
MTTSGQAIPKNPYDRQLNPVAPWVTGRVGQTTGLRLRASPLSGSLVVLIAEVAPFSVHVFVVHVLAALIVCFLYRLDNVAN